MKQLQLTLGEADTKLLLEAIAALEMQWSAFSEVTDDDDEPAEFGNDLVELRRLKKVVVDQAKQEFGNGIAKASRDAFSL